VRDEAWRPLPLRHNLWPLLFYALLFMGCAAPWWFVWRLVVATPTLWPVYVQDIAYKCERCTI
jgi:hypothetical protein